MTADYVTDKDAVKDLLERQVSSSVRWQQSVERMAADGVDTFLEIGPKKTLSSFLKKIAPKATGYHVDTMEDMEQVLEALGVQ